MRPSPLSRFTPALLASVFILVFTLAACSSDGGEESSGGEVTPVPTLVTISTPDPATAAEGDAGITAGKAVFAANGCSACHSTGENRIVGPGLAGIGERSATRVPGQTSDDYLREAITNPGAYVVEEFNNLMPGNFGNLPEEKIESLIEYLKSL